MPRSEGHDDAQALAVLHHTKRVVDVVELHRVRHVLVEPRVARLRVPALFQLGCWDRGTCLERFVKGARRCVRPCGCAQRSDA
jgi:hypothetical protein